MGPYPKALALTEIGRGIRDIGGSRQLSDRQAGSAQSAQARYELNPTFVRMLQTYWL